MANYWYPKAKLNGPGYFYGRTDAGKTWSMIAVAEVYHSKLNYKIFDIGPGKRKENTFWCFPSNEYRLWAEFKHAVGEMQGLGPKQYKVNLLIPCFSMKLPKKFPEKLPKIQASLFTLDFNEITIEDISVITGDLSKNAVYLWNQIQKNVKKDATGIDILDYINRKHKKLKGLSIYRLFIKPAVDNHLLAGRGFETNLDLIREAEDKEIISCLVHDWIPNRNWGMFIMSFIMRRILFDLAINDKIPKDNICLFREAGDYMKQVDKDAQGAEQTQIFRNSLTNIARYGRSGLILFMDTQSPKDTRNLIEGQEDLLCIKEISSIDIADILQKLKSERRLPKKIELQLHKLEKHQMVIVERKIKARLISRVQPPRCRCYKGPSFIKTWTEVFNEWRPSSIDFNLIKKAYDEAKETIEISKAKEIILEKPEEATPEQREMVLAKLEEEDEIAVF